MTDVLVWLGVAIFGALGALERFHVGNAVTARLPSDFPFGTFVVNLTGSFALGLLTGLSVTGDALLLVGTGLLHPCHTGDFHIRIRLYGAAKPGGQVA